MRWSLLAAPAFAASVVNLPPTFTAADLPQPFTTDPAFNPRIYRDGGASGSIDGRNLIVFADTMTKDDQGRLNWFVSNTIAYIGQRDPVQLTDFGKDGHPREFIPFMPNETHSPDKARIAIWPNSNIVQVAPNFAVAVAPVLKVAGEWKFQDLYSTMYSIQIGREGPVAKRLVPQLFWPGEAQYGALSMLLGPDGNLYLFASMKKGGINAARVRREALTDRRQYSYWNGFSWGPVPPPVDQEGRLIKTKEFWGGPGTGDEVLSGRFLMTWSRSGAIEGPWADPIELFQPKVPPGTKDGLLYSGHAHPEWDPSGRLLLLSYSQGSSYPKMAMVQFR